MRPPHVILIGGPNGAGKSTASSELLRGKLSVSEFVNADVIARGLSGFNPQGVALDAGKIMLRRLKYLAHQQADFAFETTLASRSFAPWLKELIDSGYHFHLVYLWLPTPEIALDRVANRIRAGGHGLKEDVIRRRYESGLRNFFALYKPLAFSWRFYDNSNLKRRLIAFGVQHSETIVMPDLWKSLKDRCGNE